MEETAGVLIFVVIAVAVVLIAVFAWLHERRRTQAFRALAGQLGLKYHAKSRGMPQQYKFLDKLAQGHSRYAFNILDGIYRNNEIRAFDYHYATGSGKNRTDHYFSFFMLRLPRAFPELRVYPENFLSKIGQTLGYEDIDFESVEFSNAFTVRSKDKKFAYDICHTRMMEYLLGHRDTAFEIERDWLAVGLDKRIDPGQVPARLDQLIEMRALFPNYLWEQ